MINYRPARPTLSDARMFGALYVLATMNMMQHYLGPKAYTTLERLFPLAHHEHSYDVTTVAEWDQTPVGLMMGYSSAAHDAMSQRTLALYIRYGILGLLRSVPTILRLRPLRSVTGTLPSDAYYVKGLAVDPSYRRQGIGQRLLQEAEKQAISANRKRMVLDVRTHNAAALALYETCGYRITAETPSLRVNDESIAFFRMEKGL